MPAVGPYQTALDLKRPIPTWIPNEQDRDRVAAYDVYEEVFRNVKEAFNLVLRDTEGDEMSRRYIPTARTIIEATNRYLAKNPVVTPLPLSVATDGQPIEADEANNLQLMALINAFFEREEFFTKFTSLKRWTLIRGDGLFHLTADDKKPQGQRLRLVELDPGHYFTLTDPLDVERIIGVYLVTLVQDDDGDLVAQRQAYLKQENGTIFTQLQFFEEDGWDDRWPLTEQNLKPVEIPSRFAEMEGLLEGFTLPNQITSIPVYHFRNRREGKLAFGISELQGIETILAGIHQTASDEDITITLTGVGIYVTTSGRPRDDEGNEQDWVIAPASVMELESHEDTFDRVKGVESVTPLLDHMNMLEGQARKTTGTPDIAVGSVDVTVAESGIALAIQMNPILAKNEETERELKSRTEQLLYDLANMWLPAYEGFTPTGVRLQITFDDPLPIDRAAVLKEIIDLVAAKLISIAYAQQMLKERLGFDISEGMIQEMANEAQLMLDPMARRMEQEAEIPPGAEEV